MTPDRGHCVTLPNFSFHQSVCYFLAFFSLCLYAIIRLISLEIEIMSNRNKELKIRLTDDEFRMLQEQSGDIPMAKYVRLMALSEHDTVRALFIKHNQPELREIIRLLANMANNLNQIAKATNEGRNIELIVLLARIEQSLLDLRYKARTGELGSKNHDTQGL